MIGEGHAFTAAMSQAFRGSWKVGILKTVGLDGDTKFNSLQQQRQRQNKFGKTKAKGD